MKDFSKLKLCIECNNKECSNKECSNKECSNMDSKESENKWDYICDLFTRIFMMIVVTALIVLTYIVVIKQVSTTEKTKSVCCECMFEQKP